MTKRKVKVVPVDPNAPRMLLDIKCDQPDYEKRAKFEYMPDAMLPKAVMVKGYTHTTLLWNGTMLYVPMWNMMGEKFWSEAALGWLKPYMFTQALWMEVPLDKLSIPHDAPHRYRD